MGLTTGLYYLFIVKSFDIYCGILCHFMSRLTLVSFIIDNWEIKIVLLLCRKKKKGDTRGKVPNALIGRAFKFRSSKFRR